jgi:hypothetical protein
MAVNPAMVDITTASQMFMDVAKQEYQNRQYLIGIGEDHDMLGTSLEIPVIEKTSMLDRGFTSGDLPITNILTRSVQIEPNDRVLKSTVGDSNATLFSYDKIQAFSKSHIMAAAREVDTIKLSSITGGTYSAAINNLVTKNSAAGTNTGLSIDQLISAQTLLEMNGYDIRSNIYLVGNAKAIKQIFNDTKFTDWDYRPARPISLEPADQFDQLLGMSVRKLGGEGSNVIAITGTPETTAVYMISSDAIANGYNKRLHSQIVSEPQNLRTSIVTGLTMGSAIVYPKGVIKIECDQIPTTNS